MVHCWAVRKVALWASKLAATMALKWAVTMAACLAGPMAKMSAELTAGSLVATMAVPLDQQRAVRKAAKWV